MRMTTACSHKYSIIASKRYTRHVLIHAVLMYFLTSEATFATVQGILVNAVRKP